MSQTKILVPLRWDARTDRDFYLHVGQVLVGEVFDLQNEWLARGHNVCHAHRSRHATASEAKMAMEHAVIETFEATPTATGDA